jgi:hypothetical protein
MYASTALDVSAKRHIIPKNLYRLGYSHVTLSMYDQEVKQLHHMYNHQWWFCPGVPLFGRAELSNNKILQK